MLNLLNRMAWILAIISGISVYSLDNDFFIFGIVIVIVVKVLLSKDFIKKSLEENYKVLDTNLVNKNTKQENFTVNTQDIVEDSFENIKPEELVKIPLNENISQTKIQQKETSVKQSPEKDEAKEPSNFEKYLNDFFSQNLMAKIGGILLTLGIIFLMSLVYSAVGPVLKIIIGFIVGFVVYFIGSITLKKGYKIEGMILLGTGILINYVVILGARFIIGENDGIISSSLTFILLVLNTLFSVLTSYIYNSKNLLLFSIFFAYFIPFLVGSSNSKYSYLIVVGYGVILSFASFFISNQKFSIGEINTSKYLFYFSLIFGNLLVLFSPLNSELSFIVKIIGFNIITFLNIYICYKNKFTKDIFALFLTAFIFLLLILSTGITHLGGDFNNIGIFISYLFSILALLFSIVFFATISAFSGLIYLIFLPIILILMILFSGNLFWSIFVIPLFLVVYLVVFALVGVKFLSNVLKYIFFVIIGVFVLISNSYFLRLNLDFNLNTQISIIVTSFLFLASTYYLSSKKDLSFMYTIGTFITILILLPIVKITGNFVGISVFSVALFGILNYLLPFINTNLTKNGSSNLVLGNILGVLFVGGNLFRFGNEYFPGTTMGISFLVLAILYFIGGYLIFLKLQNEIKLENQSNLNFIYTLIGISISLFSISVAIIFSKLPIVISLIWLLESTILVYFANKLASKKIYIASLILSLIGLLKFFILLSSNLVFSDLVGILFIFLSLVLSVYFIRNSKLSGLEFIKICHILGILGVYFSLLEIFKNESNGVSLIITSGFLLVLSVIYNILKDNFLKKSNILFLIFAFFVHVLLANKIKIYEYNYIFTLISGVILLLEYVFFKDKNSKVIATSFIIYFVCITSIYLYHFTKDSFSLTIYWGVLSLILVHLGISKINKYIRATGLYLLIITLLKISFYDIWNSIDNPIVRVIAFIFVGGIMMYISALYSKNKLSLKSDLELKQETKTMQKISNIPKINLEELIKDIDVGDIESIKFSCNNSKNFTIRSKKLFKIAVMIKNNLGKTSFQPNELKDIYDLIISNNKTELNSNDYNKLISILKDFADVGGEVEFNYKK